MFVSLARHGILSGVCVRYLRRLVVMVYCVCLYSEIINCISVSVQV